MCKIKRCIRRIEATIISVAMMATVISSASIYGAEAQNQSEFAYSYDIEDNTISEVLDNNDSIFIDESVVDNSKFIGIIDEEENLELVEKTNIEEIAETKEEIVEAEEEIVDTEDVSEIQMMYVDEPEYLIQAGGFAVCDEALLAGTSAIQNVIYNGLKKKSSNIDLSSYGLNGARLTAIYYTTIDEHPDIYYATTGLKYTCTIDGTVLAVQPVYMTGLDDAAFNSAVDNALSVIKPGMSDVEKAIVLHDYIAQNTRYSSVIYSQPNPIFTAYGVFVNQSAVCQGYAMAYKLLLERAGIKAGVVRSEGAKHAWNYIELDGKLYNVDVTWDDPVSDVFGRVCHNHMFLSDDAMYSFHPYDDWEITYDGNVIGKGTADSTTYDSAYWSNINSPFVWDSTNEVYYIQGLNLYRGDILGTQKSLVTSIYSSYSYYYPCYGLFEIKDRLYYTQHSGIFSVKKDGTDSKKSVDLSSAGYSLYGCAYSYLAEQGSMVIKYELGGECFYSTLANVSGLQGYTVKFLNDNGTLIKQQSVLEHDSATAPALAQRIGYDAKWDKKFDDIASDLEVNATYIPIEYSITYNLVKPGATNSAENPEIYTIEDAVTFKEPTYPGYTFAGWYTNSNYSSSSLLKSISKGRTGDITLYAKWTAKRPSAPIINVEGDFVVLDNGNVLFDEGTSISITCEENANIHYTTDGTTPTANSPVYSDKIEILTNTTIKVVAVREKQISTVATSKFVVADNRLVFEDATVIEGQTNQLIPTVVPTTKNVSDISWASLNETIVTVNDTGIITGVNEGTATIRATIGDWKGRTVTVDILVKTNPTSYYVSFLGHNGKLIEKQPVLNGRDAVAPAMDYIPEGYAFVKWDRAFNNVVENIEVKAVWALMDYELSFSTNKGTAPETIAFNIESSEIVLPTLAKEGYEFVGWYDNESFDGTPITYIPSGSTGDRTLYAKWTNSKTFSLKWEGLDFDEDLRVSYTGKALKPSFEVYYGDKKLEYKKDYTYTFKNNTNAYELEESDEGFVASKAPTLVITGKGNYCATESVPFVIERKSIEDNDIDIIPVSLAFNGKTQKVAPTVSWNGKKLTGKELTFEYISTDERAYIDKGTYDVKITGKGNYCSEKTVNLVISDLKDADKPVVLMKQCKVSITPFDYDGKVIDFTDDNYNSHIKVTYNKMPVDYVGAADEDGYDVQFISSYYNKVGEEYQLQPIKDIGTYTVRIIGKGKYQGEVRATFKINGTSISTTKIAAIPNMIFDGNEKEPALDIKDKAGNPLTQGTDYTVSFTNRTNVGTASVTITGINKYYGTTKKTFKITQQIVADLASADNFDISFVGGTDEFVYAKNGVTPKLDVIYKYTNKQGDPATTKLVEGTDYSLSYKNNNTVIPAAGKTPYVILTLKKNFKGTRNIPFTIVQQDLSNLSITVNDIQEKTVAGKYMSTPTITDVNGKKLGKGDYITTYEYRDKDNNQLLDKYSKPVAGDTIAITVTGTKNYKGTITGYYRVFAAGKSISSATIKIKPEVLNEVRYTGEAIMLSKDDLEIKIGKNVYLTTDDFDIKESSYVNNINKGTAKVTIVGKGDYAGTKTISFTIKQKAFMWWWK